MTETVGGASRANSRTGAAASVEGVSARTLNRARRLEEDGLGFDVDSVTLEDGSALDYTVVDTLMRIDLPGRAETGDSVTFTINWDHVLIETAVIGGRSGWECFEEDGEGGDCIYQMAQWFRARRPSLTMKAGTTRPSWGVASSRWNSATMMSPSPCRRISWWRRPVSCRTRRPS